MKKRLFFIFFSLLLPISAKAIIITPAINEIVVDPGEVKKIDYTIINNEKYEIKVTAAIEVFQPKNNQGQPEIVSSDSQILSWIKLSANNFVIAPGEKKIIPITLSVPQTASVGGYYAALMWSGQSMNRQGQLSISGRVGSLLLVTVDGDIKEEIKINDWKIKNSKTIYWKKPIKFETKITNSGNVHIKPTGKIVITNMFGRAVAAISINDENGNILPRSSRIFSAEWTHGPNKTILNKIENFFSGFNIGRYSAEIQLEYGKNQTRASSEKINFWFLPLPVLLLVILGILVLIVSLVKKIKK